MIRNFVTKPLFTLSLYIILLIIGWFSFSSLPLDFLPNISIPTLTVITSYPGASASDIETSVSKVIEDAVATVPNVDKVISDSQENISIVTLSFKWGTKLDGASADVRDKMDLIRGKLPDGVQSPTIYKFDLSQIPVLTLGVSADQSFNDLYEICDKRIINALKKVKGVGTVTLRGGLQRQINIDINKNRLEAYHLSVGQINQALQGSNISLPAGSLKSGALDYGLRVPGEFKNMGEIGSTVVGAFQGKDIFLSDIATIKDDYKE